MALQRPTAQIGPPELPDYYETADAIAKGGDPDRLSESLLAAPVEVLPMAAATWSNALAYLDKVFPRRAQPQLTGTTMHEPSKGEWAEWGWAWRIANNPLVVIDLAADGTLIGAEVDHLRAMFPAIYAEICSAISDSLADRSSKKKDWTPPWWLQKQLCGILRVSPASPSLLKDIDLAVQQSEQETQQRTASISGTGAERRSTPNQRISEK